jgi:signal transduction histidine kinase
MHAFKKKRLAWATAVYWVLLVYIIAALVWWFIALHHQSLSMTRFRLDKLDRADPAYNEKVAVIHDQQKTETTQYIGEGATFLALILVGAVFVYRAVRRQINLQEQQQNFMMAITHELKTPIAIAQLNLETLQKHQLDEKTRQKLIRIALEETNRLNNLASNILVSAQLEDNRYKPAKDDLDLSRLVQDTFDEVKNRYPSRKFKAGIDPEIEIRGDQLLLQILVNNLLENAVRYSTSESTTTCRLSRKNGIKLQVTDEGSGIPEKEKKNIFKKFYRLGSEATREAKGTGLGLYLCRKIATDHHATIQIRDNHPRGSEFAVIFAAD